MEIKIECPWCNQEYSVDESLLGQKVECSVCEKEFTIRYLNSSASISNRNKENKSFSQENRRTSVDSHRHEEEKRADSNNISGKVSRKIIVISASFVVLIVLSIVIYLKSIPESQYKRGLEAYKERHNEEAVEFFQKAAERGHQDAQKEYYKAMSEIDFEKGKKAYEEHHYEEAVDHFKSAAEQGHAQAQLLLGLCYYNGNGIKRDDDETVRWFRKAAEQDNVDAQFRLGLCYQNGIGVNSQPEEALFWFKKAAEKGHQEAQINLGDLYYSEKKLQNFSEALNWYQKAGELGRDKRGERITVCSLIIKANEGDAHAQLLVSFLYQNGSRGLQQDRKEAIRYLRMSAASGQVEAQYMLGGYYFTGDNGLEKNTKEALYWFQKASNQGYDKAQYALGNMYFIKREFQEAVKWFLEAAKQGNVNAMEALYDCYSNGLGVEKDLFKALEWNQKMIEALEDE